MKYSVVALSIALSAFTISAPSSQADSGCNGKTLLTKNSQKSLNGLDIVVPTYPSDLFAGMIRLIEQTPEVLNETQETWGTTTHSLGGNKVVYLKYCGSLQNVRVQTLAAELNLLRYVPYFTFSSKKSWNSAELTQVSPKPIDRGNFLKRLAQRFDSTSQNTFRAFAQRIQQIRSPLFLSESVYEQKKIGETQFKSSIQRYLIVDLDTGEILVFEGPNEHYADFN